MKLDFCAPIRPGLLSWLLFAIGVTAAAWSLSTWMAADELHRAAEARLASLQRPAPPSARVAPPTDRATLAYLRHDAAARDQLALPWTGLFDSLHSLRPAEIALLSLDADGRRADFTLTALAIDQSALLDWFDELRQAPALDEVSLTRHEMREVDGLQVVYFNLRGKWRRP